MAKQERWAERQADDDEKDEMVIGIASLAIWLRHIGIARAAAFLACLLIEHADCGKYRRACLPYRFACAAKVGLFLVGSLSTKRMRREIVLIYSADVV